jgi:nicotinate phosphoribosyltransferase
MGVGVVSFQSTKVVSRRLRCNTKRLVDSRFQNGYIGARRIRQSAPTVYLSITQKFADMFHVASEKEIRSGKVTDVYFERAFQVLRAKKINKRVKAEFVVKRFPNNYEWGVFAGLEECAEIFRGLTVSVKAMEEGTIFRTDEPVMTIEGRYLDFCLFETPLLGLICQASGIATKAARCRLAAGEKRVVHFGARRMHPAISTMIDRSSYIGGCDAVATINGAEFLGLPPAGTMPHALVLLFGDTVAATKAFDEVIEKKVNRISLIDTFNDEKFEALRVARALGKKLYGVRLDTPGSRRGDLLAIANEVRWELDMHGYTNVKIFVSGGIDETAIRHLNPVVDAYGVGTSISSAPVLDYAMDIVEIEGVPVAKRGKRSGEKQVYRNVRTNEHIVLPTKERFRRRGYEPMLTPFFEKGKLRRKLRPPREIREYVLKQLKTMRGAA